MESNKGYDTWIWTRYFKKICLLVGFLVKRHNFYTQKEDPGIGTIPPFTQEYPRHH